MLSGHHPRVAQLSPKELDGLIASVKRVIATLVEAVPAHEAFIPRYGSAEQLAPVAAQSSATRAASIASARYLHAVVLLAFA